MLLSFPKMALTDSEIKFKKVAAILGLIQGLAWTIMSLMCIFLYNTEKITKTPTTYMESVGISIYQIFLYSNEESFSGQLLTGNAFEICMFAHLFLNIVWMTLSVYMFVKEDPDVIKYWSYCTLYVSIWDATTAIMLSADYSKCLDFMRDRIVNNVEDTILLESACVNPILPVVVIAAKGFTLWILNVCTACCLLVIRKRE